ncbi:DUF6415 family natural product biosynthesis protein [Streptomyces griseosporeus]|uniref:DUF6415 family natural product biosynthesis protein n=1 Tax=Streptomyces griseosporeus TaxID=1910 RepID=UPI003788D9D1
MTRAASSNATAPVDIATMLQTAARLIHADGRPVEPAPDAATADELTALMCGQLQLLIGEVEQMLGRQAGDSIRRYCATACIGEARRKLSAEATPRYGGHIGHARRLARVLRALCEHYTEMGLPSRDARTSS